MIRYSLLDLAPITQGSGARQALHNSRSLAQEAERCGYHRFWLAEHHNMTGIASAATSVVIGYVAEGTSQIRVGSGGIMLPNHAPLMVAEQFGTLAALYPGRIDLGLGRAPGTDSLTMQALRRYHDSVDQFPKDVQELQHYFRAATPGQAVRAVPGEGLEVPLWLLGSSAWAAVCVRISFCPGLPDAGTGHLSHPIPPVRATGRTLLYGRHPHVCRQHRRGGPISAELGSAAVHCPAPGHTRPAQTTGTQH